MLALFLARKRGRSILRQGQRYEPKNDLNTRRIHSVAVSMVLKKQ